MMGKNEHRKTATVAGTKLPPLAVWYENPGPEFPHHSGYLFLADAPDPDEVTEDDLEGFCLHCLIDRWPEVGRGLDLAREHGAADYDADSQTWQPA